MNNESQRKELFESILQDYHSLVAKICYMYADNDEQRKDLYQECMANVWQGLRSFRGDAKLSTWLYRACLNTCITYSRRQQRRDIVSIDDSTHQLAADDNSRPDDLKEMYRLISTLNAVDKALIMMWLDEKSYDEISEVSGMLRNTVASRLRRIKQHLVDLANS